MATSESTTMDPVSVLKLYKEKGCKINVPDALTCLHCNFVLINAIQTKCGCRYCKECIDRRINEGKRKCIGGFDDCEEAVVTYIPDPATNRDITMQRVKCLYDGCEFEDAIRYISMHLGTCQYQEEICVLCKSCYIRANKEKHLEQDCAMREVKCVYCGKRCTFKDLTDAHNNVKHSDLCSKYVGLCPYNCDTTKEVLVRDHVEKCTNEPLKCSFSIVNCKQIIPKKDMKDHLVDNMHEHILELCQLVEDMRNKIESLEDNVASLNKKMESMKDNYERKISELEANSNRNDARGKEKNESVFRNGKYIWKIVNFSKLKENAMNGRNLSVLSDSFYTAEFGYKMCLKIYPYGDGLGKGSHLSVFFVIMRGEYDDLQQWPFRNKVTLTILDDLMKTTNHSDTFKPDARSICYQKPQEELNIASGSPKFILFTDLDNYLKNDILYLQIAVLP